MSERTKHDPQVAERHRHAGNTRRPRTRSEVHPRVCGGSLGSPPGARAARIGFIPAAAGFASPLRVRRALPLVDPRFCRVACKVLKTSGLRPRFCAVPRLVRQLIHDVGRLDRFRRLNRRVRAARTGWKLGTGHRSRAPPVRPALAGRPRRLPIRTSALVALCSLWRKSRIRPGPGAIEPVH